MSAVFPEKIYDRLIFHVDVNSAFLSWSALRELELHPGTTDLRTIPSAVAGDVESRRGIITAKSIPAKKYGVKTAEPVAQALRKCPHLVLVKSDFATYRMYSRELMDILHRWAPRVEQVSIDEAYLDMTWLWDRSENAADRGERIFKEHAAVRGEPFFKENAPAEGIPLPAAIRNNEGALSEQEFTTDKGNTRPVGLPLLAAKMIREEVLSNLGFTVNVGISVNRLLAKTASDFTKPDETHTLWPEEIPEKLWPMDIEELHGCGHATAERLRTIGITTVGDAAATDPEVLRALIGNKSSEYIIKSSKGIGSSLVRGEEEDAKSYSNETTTAEDIGPEEYETKMLPIIRDLSDHVSRRLKRDGMYGQTVTFSVKTDEFRRRSKQTTLADPSNDADIICSCALTLSRDLLFGENGPFTRGEKIRLVGVGVTKLDKGEFRQMSLFDFLPKGGMPNGSSGTASSSSVSSAVPAAENETVAEKSASRRKKLDDMMSKIRSRYGDDSIHRGPFEFMK